MLEKITGWTAAAFAALIAASAFVGLLALFRAMSGVLWSQEAAGWAQAIGSVAALAVTFNLFYAQRRDELMRAQSERIFIQTKSVISVMSLSSRAIVALETAIEQMECQHPVGIIPFRPEHLDELRILFAPFIDPTTDFLALQSAIEFSGMLMQAKEDFAAASNEHLKDLAIERSYERLRHAENLHRMGSDHQVELVIACGKYGLNPIAGQLVAAKDR